VRLIETLGSVGLSWLSWVVTGRQDADAVLQRVTDTAGSAGVEAVAHPVEGHPAEALIKVAAEQDGDVIVVLGRP
jgi:nucleotide-binding universal stress UspA family protein